MRYRIWPLQQAWLKSKIGDKDVFFVAKKYILNLPIHLNSITWDSIQNESSKHFLYWYVLF